MTSDTSDTIANDLRGKLYDPQLLQKINGCGRCEAKNQKLRCAQGIDPVEGTSIFQHGDCVQVHAVRRDDLWGDAHWTAAAVHHRDHPQRPFVDGVVQGTDQARVNARIHVTDQAKHIVDIDVTAISPADDGPQASKIQQRQQQYIDDDDDSCPDHATVLDRGPADPPAHWPESERQWLRQLKEEHGPLELPHTHLGFSDGLEGGPTRLNPGEDRGRSR